MAKLSGFRERLYDDRAATDAQCGGRLPDKVTSQPWRKRGHVQGRSQEVMDNLDSWLCRA